MYLLRLLARNLIRKLWRGPLGPIFFALCYTAAAVQADESLTPTRTENFANATAAACSRFYVNFETYVPEPLKKPLTFTGYVTGVIPLAKTLQNKDKIFFVLLESPVTGLITTPVSVMVAQMLTKHGVHMDMAVAKDMWEVYWTYQTGNIVRNGVSIDTSLTNGARSWLNWWFSASITALGTAGGKLAEATTLKAAEHAYSLVTYAMTWPLFSQQISQHFITPLLFSKFPKKSILDAISDSSRTTASLLEDQRILIKETESAISKLKSDPTVEKANQAELRKLEEELVSARFSERWVEWFRKDHVDGSPLSKMRTNQYWAIKTSVSMATAVFMVSLYYIARWELVGETENDDGAIKKAVRAAMKQMDPSSPSLKDVAEKQWDEAVKAVRSLIEEHKTFGVAARPQ